MAAIPAVQFMIEDHGDNDPPSGFRKTFAEDKPYKSLLQRHNMSLPELLTTFEWGSDNGSWLEEYAKPLPKVAKLIKYKRRVNYCVCGWRELNEDFGRGDVSCLRDIRTPLVASRTPMKQSKDEFGNDD